MKEITNTKVIHYLAQDGDGNTISGSLGCDAAQANTILSKLYSKYKIFENDFGDLDPDYLSAYDINKKSIKINIEKVKEIKKDSLRRLRADKLKELDVKFMLALESGDRDGGNKVIEEKKKLRDITDLVDAATSLDQIKAIGI